MIDSEHKFQLREYPRYGTGDESPVRVDIKKLSADQGQSVAGELVDFSRNGVKLAVDSPVDVEDRVKIRIRLDSPATDLTVSASVCWVEHYSDRFYVIGCQFAGELPYSIVPRMATAGYLERRTEIRYAVEFPATVRCASDHSVEFAVDVKNVSESGFRILSPQPLKAGEEFSLLLDCDGSQVEILARAQWRADADGGYMIGCSFPAPEGFDLLCQAATQVEVMTV